MLLYGIKSLIALIVFGVVYIVFSWFRVLIAAVKIDRFLQNNDYKQWEHITSVGRWGPGIGNIFRSLRFIYNRSADDVQEVTRLKLQIRRGIRDALNSVLGIVVAVVVLAYLILSGRLGS